MLGQGRRVLNIELQRRGKRHADKIRILVITVAIIWVIMIVIEVAVLIITRIELMVMLMRPMMMIRMIARRRSETTQAVNNGALRPDRASRWMT